MNIGLQIGLGLIPGLVLILFLQVKKRMYRKKSMLLSLFMALSCVVCLVSGIRTGIREGFIESQISKKEIINFANALVLEGAYDSAIEVISDYDNRYGYDNECRLLLARISLLEADYDRANALYDYLCKNTNLVDEQSQEVFMARNNIVDIQGELLQIQYLLSQNENIEDYGYTNERYITINKQIEEYDFDKQREEIFRQIEKEYKLPKESISYAEVIAELAELSDGEVVEKESTKKYKRVFSKLEEGMPELLELNCVNNARIKAYVMAGNFEDISRSINSESTYHELLVASEMYMGGFIRQSDFDNNYANYDDVVTDELVEQLEKIYQKNYKNFTKVERRKLKTRINALSVQLDNPELLTMKTQLIQQSEDMPSSDQTKVYLEVAKIEHYFGNETGTDRYLSEAIYSSTNNEDDEYVYGMTQIINVIENDEDDELENIKKVSEYVDIVLDNSLTIDVEEFLSSTEINEESDEGDTSFAQVAVDHVTKAKSAISIGKVDVSSFEKVVARVQISSDSSTGINDLRNKVTIYDCGMQIDDFDLQKVEYTGTNIMLVCDVSGSMSGNIQDLRDAVITFINDRNGNESLSVVTFDDSIVETKNFGTPDDEMLAFAEAMSAMGGTDIFSAVANCVGAFPNDKNRNNVLILMTDGQDGNPKSAEIIYEQIGTVAESNGVTVYTMGLGNEVDTVYLNTIAGSGNGEFLYVSDSASLSTFYDMLHEQVDNQYEITYSARDTLTVSGRTIEVCIQEDNTRDVKTYSLNEIESEGSELSIYEGLTIAGLSPRYLYKGNQDVPVKLYGTGFSKDMEVTVSLEGNIDYKLSAVYNDEQNYIVTIPASIAVGDYAVEISIDGKKKVIENGFSVIVAGGEKKTQFGPYVFTSCKKVQGEDGTITLSGMVTMNGWLRFKGDVSIFGDLNSGGYIDVVENSGSYVEFDKATAEGIGKYFAEKGIAFDVPALGRFKLYNDPENIYDYENYQVDEIKTGLLQVYSLMRFDSPSIRLYPNSIGMYFNTGTTVLPYQDKIIDMDDMFSFKLDCNAQLTDRNLGVVLEAECGDPEDTYYGRRANFLNSTVYLNGSANVKVNTISNEYAIGAMVHVAFLADESGFGVDISWKENMVPDAVKLSLKLGKPLKLPTTFPIEVKDFSFEVGQINDALKSGNFAKLKFTGTTSLSSMAISAYAPKIAKVIGKDLSLLEMPDTSASICLSPIALEADATLKFLSEIKIAEAGVKLGNFEQTNALLGLNSAEVAGLSARIKLGVMWDTADDRISLELSGEGTLDAHTRFVGVDVKGTAAYDISWWIINSEAKKTGEFALGLYTTHDEKQQFVFVYRTTNSNGKVKGAFYYIDENGKCGSKNGTLS